MIGRYLLLGTALSAVLLLSSCSDPEGEANKEFVSISTELTQASKTEDPVAKYTALSALSIRISQLTAKYADTGVAVHIASDEKIGPYRPSELATEIDKLSRSPAFCEQKPTSACIFDWVTEHEKNLSEKDRQSGGGFRVAIKLRRGDIGNAVALADQVEMLQKKMRRENSQNKMVPLDFGLTQYIVDRSYSPGFWKVDAALDAVRVALRANSPQDALDRAFRLAIETRLEQFGDLDTIKEFIALANERKDDPKILNKVLDLAKRFVREGMGPERAKAIRDIWPKDKLALLLSDYDATDLWAAMSETEREQIIAAWPTDEMEDIRWDVQKMLRADFLKGLVNKRTTPKDKAFAARAFLTFHGKDVSAKEFLSIARVGGAWDRQYVTSIGIIERLVTKREDAVILADYIGHKYWLQIASAEDGQGVRKVLRDTAAEKGLSQDHLRFIEIARRRPDLLPPSELVELSFIWADNNYQASRAGVQLYMGDLEFFFLGKWAEKSISNSDVQKYVDTYLSRPHLVDKSRLARPMLLDDLRRRGMVRTVEQYSALAEKASDWRAEADRLTSAVEAAVGKKDVQGAIAALSSMNAADRVQYLQGRMILLLDEPVRKAVWDIVVKNDPESAGRALGDIRRLGEKPQVLRTAVLSLPSVYANTALSEQDRLSMQFVYVRWLWLMRDAENLSGVVFHPETVHPIVWYEAADALLGLYTNAAN